MSKLAHNKFPDVWNEEGFPINMEGLTDSSRGGLPSEKHYYSYTCVDCGKIAENTYSDPYYSTFLRDRVCFYCNCDRERSEKLKKDYNYMTIIDGRVYGPGNRTEGSFRGMAGRRFDIEYIGDSIHAGKKITTFDLWAGGELTPKQREEFPDTAKFWNGAEEVKLEFKDPQTGEKMSEEEAAKRGAQTRCWQQSDGKTPPFPLPRSLRPELR